MSDLHSRMLPDSRGCSIFGHTCSETGVSCQVNGTTRIVAIHIVQTKRACNLEGSALLSPMSSQLWVGIRIGGLANALLSLQAALHGGRDHTVVPLVPEQTIGSTCTGKTPICPRNRVDVNRVGRHAPRSSCYLVQGRVPRVH